GEVVLGRMLQLGGLAEGDINLVELPFADQVPALANGAIDVGSTVEPFITEAERRGVARLWKTTGEIYPYQQFAVVPYSPLFADHGYIPDPPNLDRVIDLAYVDYAMARLGSYQR